jgi:uncharacterized protein (TIGR03083 family)
VAALRKWYEEAAGDLLAVLREAAPDTPSWSWWGDTTAGEVARRQAHEALVHRWDAEAAVGEPGALDPALAADGVTEFGERMLCRRDDSGWTGRSGRIVATAPDVGAWWIATVGGAGPVLASVPGEPAGEPADAVVEAPAGSLDLWLWRRPATVTVRGDARLASEFRAWSQLG